MSNKQIIISVGREFGSGGHEIAEKLANRFGVTLYDNNLLTEIAEKKEIDIKSIEKYDEIPKNRLIFRNVNGYSNSPEENIAKIQFDYLRKRAEDGESFVVVGRCSEEVLKDFDCMTSVFILGDMDAKIKRITKLYDVSEERAEKIIIQCNKKRKSYHNYYCKGKWGDSRNYELSINSSKLGTDITTDIIEMYINEKMRKSDT